MPGIALLLRYRSERRSSCSTSMSGLVEGRDSEQEVGTPGWVKIRTEWFEKHVSPPPQV